jgi:hypothetical protein
MVAFLDIRNISPINPLSSKMRYLKEEICCFDFETENCNLRGLGNSENGLKIGLCKGS